MRPATLIAVFVLLGPLAAFVRYTDLRAVAPAQCATMTS